MFRRTPSSSVSKPVRMSKLANWSEQKRINHKPWNPNYFTWLSWCHLLAMFFFFFFQKERLINRRIGDRAGDYEICPVKKLTGFFKPIVISPSFNIITTWPQWWSSLYALGCVFVALQMDHTTLFWIIDRCMVPFSNCTSCLGRIRWTGKSSGFPNKGRCNIWVRLEK